ncbi:MAG: FecR family protein [Planctomycetales bacterium]|nr:FecR family protein [Planctomycetales bacterium]
MMQSDAKFAELNDLLSRLCDGEMDRPDWDRLETLLLDDPAAQDYYRRFVVLDVDLAWRAAGRSAGLSLESSATEARGSETGDSGFGTRDSGPHVSRTPNPEPLFPPIILDLSPTSHYPLSTPFVGSWAFSCMVSAAIMGVAMLGAWAVKITHHQHFATAPAQSAPSRDRPDMVFVGRITGLLDVKWSADPRYLPPMGYAHVSLGRKYKLDSGLMEITYDSGAKVILQGPCSYEVESSSGGYLALGKLTARVESGEWRVESGGSPANQKSEIRNQKSSPLSTLHSPLFSVRTPTAVVTDLGTEFGVEVDKSGVTESHVFSGSVKVLVLDADGNLPSPSGRGAGGEGNGREVILGENESARVERAEDRLVVVRGLAPGKVDGFVRSLRPKPVDAPEIVERFDGPRLGAAFEQNPPRRYVFERGAAVYSPPLTDDGRGRQSRGYIRTVATDFCDRDFVFEATFQVRLDVFGEAAAHHWIYFGIGDGVPNANYFDEVSSGLVLAFSVDNNWAFVQLCRPDTTAAREGDDNKAVAEVAPFGGTLGPGRHRFRMSKTGKWATFAVDADFKGQFHEDFTSPPLDLPAAAPLSNATNSRLLVGTGNCDTMTVRFEELSVTFPKSPEEGTSPGGATVQPSLPQQQKPLERRVLP